LWIKAKTGQLVSWTEPVGSVRVPPKDFEISLKSLISKIKKQGAEVIVLTTKTNLPDAGQKMDVSSKAEIQSLYGKARSLWKNNKIEESKVLFKRIIEMNSSVADSYYYLSALEAKEGNFSEAANLFETAKDNEPYRIKEDVEEYNKIVNKVVKGGNALLGDITSWMGEADTSRFFVDPIHFSKLGNQVVAKGIHDIIIENNLLMSHER
jgi:tetratricopeptide (TPR) repeat protein